MKKYCHRFNKQKRKNEVWSNTIKYQTEEISIEQYKALGYSLKEIKEAME